MKRTILVSSIISVLLMCGCTAQETSSSYTETTTTTTVITTTPTTTTTVIETEPVETEPVLKEEEIFIEDGSTILGLTAEGKELTSISIPKGITSIDGGKSGFRHANVEELFISNTVTDIGHRAFQYCNNLETVTFEPGCKLTEYNDWFASDHNIKSIEFPNGFKSINTSLNINSIQKVVIPSTVTALPECLFDFDYYTAERNGDAVTTSVEIYTKGDNITAIGKYDDLEYINYLIEHKDEYGTDSLFEDLQKLLLPTFSDTVSYYTEQNPDKLVNVKLHCDKDSLLDKIFNDASWVTIEYNPESLVKKDDSSNTDNSSEDGSENSPEEEVEVETVNDDEF